MLSQNTLPAVILSIESTLYNHAFCTFFPTVYNIDIRAYGVVTDQRHPVPVASQHVDTDSNMHGTLTPPRAVCRLTPPIDPRLLTHDAVIGHVGE